MRIAAPISSVAELEMLLECGADELYCGLNTPEWEAAFGGAWWMNRRSPRGANIPSWEELQGIVAGAHAARVPVHVTLNAPFYPAAALSRLLDLAQRLTGDLGVDGLIVSDLNLIARLAEANPPTADLHLSSLGACTNSRAAVFYASLGVKRIILPRQLRISEVERIVTDGRIGRRLEFEIFAVNDGCYFEEGLCQTSHAVGSPFCLTDWDVRAHRPGGGRGKISAAEMARHRKALREYLWYQNNCGSSMEESGVPNGPCSLCWFAHFRDWGIASVKIVGREASFYRKMRSLQLVRAVMDEVRSGATRDAVAGFARSVRGTPAYCEKGYMCYFDHPAA